MSLIPSPALLGQNGLLEVRAQIADDIVIKSDCADVWRAMLRKFVSFVAVGGLSCVATEGRFGYLDLLQANTDGSGRLSATLEARNVNGFAATALARVIGAFHTQVTVLVRASLVVPVDWPRSTWPLVEREQLPFQFEDRREVLRNGIKFTLSFRSYLSEAAAVRTEDAFGAWFSCVNLGIFSDTPDEARGSFVDLGDDLQHSGNVLVLQTGEYLFAEPIGIDALLQVMCWVHKNIASIEHVAVSDIGD